MQVVEKRAPGENGTTHYGLSWPRRAPASCDAWGAAGQGPGKGAEPVAGFLLGSVRSTKWSAWYTTHDEAG